MGAFRDFTKRLSRSVHMCSYMSGKRCNRSSRTFLVRWLSKIFVTRRIKAPFLVYKFFMMYLLILEGVPSKTTDGKNKMACTDGKNKMATMVVLSALQLYCTL